MLSVVPSVEEIRKPKNRVAVREFFLLNVFLFFACLYLTCLQLNFAVALIRVNALFTKRLALGLICNI